MLQKTLDLASDFRINSKAENSIYFKMLLSVFFKCKRSWILCCETFPGLESLEHLYFMYLYLQFKLTSMLLGSACL